MIKYHGTPVGGTKFDAIRFLSGRHALVSYIAQTHLPEVLECCESFCLDNGAFTIWRQGGQLDLVGYRDWVDKLSNHPAMDFYLIPDVIGGGEDQNDTLLKEWRKDFTGVPVFHLGESPDRFLRLAGEYGHVALGSTDSWGRTGTERWWTTQHTSFGDLQRSVARDSGGTLYTNPIKQHERYATMALYFKTVYGKDLTLEEVEGMMQLLPFINGATK